MNLSRIHIIEVLGIDIPLNESVSIPRDLQERILHEQLLYESFLTSLKDYAKDKISKPFDTIKDWKDAAVALYKVLSDPIDLGNFTNSFWKSFKRTTLPPFYDFLKKIKLDALIPTIKELIDSITSLSGWKKFLASTAIGSIIYYVIKKLEKLPLDEISTFITKYISDSALKDVLGELTDFKSYLGWLQPIIKGVEMFYGVLKPTIDKFKDVFKHRGESGFKLDKEVKDTINESFHLKERWQKLAGIV